MELRHLRYFIAVAEELNYRRAAARLFIAAPPLSVQIKNLEQEIGVALFARQGRGIKLTEGGRAFLDHARKTLASANRGITIARQAANGKIGHLSIGYNAPAGFLVFPKVVPAFRRSRPLVQITFHALNMPQQLEGLRREELDVGFVWLPVPSNEFDAHELVREPLMAVIPASHRLAKLQQISTKELSDEPLILPSRLLHPDTYGDIERSFKAAGAKMNVAYELEAGLSMINFVAMGIGCSLLPSYARSIRQPGVVFRPMKAPALIKTLAVIKLKGRSGLPQTFATFTAEHLGSPDGKGMRSGHRTLSADSAMPHRRAVS